MGDNLFGIFAAGLTLILLIWQLIDTLRASSGRGRNIKIMIGLSVLLIAFPIASYQYIKDKHSLNLKPRVDASHHLNNAIRELDYQLMRVRDDIEFAKGGKVQTPSELDLLNAMILDKEISQQISDHFTSSIQIFTRSQSNIIRSLNDGATEDFSAVAGGLIMYRSILQAVRMHAMVEKLYLDGKIAIDEANQRHSASNAIETNALLSGLLNIELNFSLAPKANSEAKPMDGRFFCASYDGASTLNSTNGLRDFTKSHYKTLLPINFQDSHYDKFDDDIGLFLQLTSASIVTFFGEKEADRFIAGYLVGSYIENAKQLDNKPSNEEWETVRAYFSEANKRIDLIDAPIGAFEGWANLYANVFLNIGSLHQMVDVFIQRFDKMCSQYSS